MTDKLSLYNQALRHIGERKIASVTENRESRRTLDDVWDLDFFLEEGLWRFATRSVKLSYSPSVTPAFGYRRAFDHPDDYIRLCQITDDEYLQSPLRHYKPEGHYWFADLDEIYVAYVSNDTNYGADFSLWTSSFEKWVAAWLASQICTRITGKEDKFPQLFQLQDRLLGNAKSKDAMEEPTKMPPLGNWATSRSGRRGSWRDGGNRNSLIG